MLLVFMAIAITLFVIVFKVAKKDYDDQIAFYSHTSNSNSSKAKWRASYILILIILMILLIFLGLLFYKSYEGYCKEKQIDEEIVEYEHEKEIVYEEMNNKPDNKSNMILYNQIEERIEELNNAKKQYEGCGWWAFFQ